MAAIIKFEQIVGEMLANTTDIGILLTRDTTLINNNVKYRNKNVLVLCISNAIRNGVHAYVSILDGLQRTL